MLVLTCALTLATPLVAQVTPSRSDPLEHWLAAAEAGPIRDSAYEPNKKLLLTTKAAPPVIVHRSYGGALLLAHIGGTYLGALMLESFGADTRLILLVPGISPSIVHAAHDNPGRGVASLIGMPAAMVGGWGLYSTTLSTCNASYCETRADAEAKIFGALVYAVAVGIDVGTAYYNVELPFTPSVTPTQGGAMGRMSMRF